MCIYEIFFRLLILISKIFKYCRFVKNMNYRFCDFVRKNGYNYYSLYK